MMVSSVQNIGKINPIIFQTPSDKVQKYGFNTYARIAGARYEEDVPKERQPSLSNNPTVSRTLLADTQGFHLANQQIREKQGIDTYARYVEQVRENRFKTRFDLLI